MVYVCFFNIILSQMPFESKSIFLLKARFKLKGTSLWTKVREIMLTRSSETAMIRVHLFPLTKLHKKKMNLRATISLSCSKYRNPVLFSTRRFPLKCTFTSSSATRAQYNLSSTSSFCKDLTLQ